MGPVRLLYRVTGPRPAYFVERTQISEAVDLSSWAGQFFQRKILQSPTWEEAVGLLRLERKRTPGVYGHRRKISIAGRRCVTFPHCWARLCEIWVGLV